MQTHQRCVDDADEEYNAYGDVDVDSGNWKDPQANVSQAMYYVYKHNPIRSWSKNTIVTIRNQLDKCNNVCPIGKRCVAISRDFIAE